MSDDSVHAKLQNLFWTRQVIAGSCIFEQQDPVISASTGGRSIGLNAPAIRLVDLIGDAVTRVIPDLAYPLAFDNAFVQGEALASWRIKDGERTIRRSRGANLRTACGWAVQDDVLIRH